jgi:hypothetical protein
MPAPPERLARLQKRFADHLRDPDNHPAPEGIEERRLAIYRRLFFNNLSSLFSVNFPIARKTLSDQRWRRLIRAFMVEHRATTPLFPEIGREFVRFLEEHPEQVDDWPWLPEVCHWQFLGTRVRNDEAEIDALDVESDGDPLNGAPVINPTLRTAQYRWPVDEIDAKHPPERPSSVSLAIFRKPNDRIGRLKINAVTGRLLEILQENPGMPGQKCLKTLAVEIRHPDPGALIEHGTALMASLRLKSLLLGVRPVSDSAV